MNFKKEAEKLESFLEEELRANVPLVVLPDKTIVYKTFKIKRNKIGDWDLKHSNNDIIDSFKLKTSAILAAKYYEISDFNKYNNIKMLDSLYWINVSDTNFFKQRFLTTKDLDRKDIYLSRWVLTRSRTRRYKDEISSLFSRTF